MKLQYFIKLIQETYNFLIHIQIFMQSMITLLTKIILLLHLAICYPQVKSRQKIPYELAFSQDSKVTAIFLTCSKDRHESDQHNILKDSIDSFFYFNTYPLKQFMLVDQCSDFSTATKSYLESCLPVPDNQNKKNKQFVRVIEKSQGFITSVDYAFSMVTTKYVLFMPTNWITVSGFGLLDQAVDVLDYANDVRMKVLQVTQMYPLWGEYRTLGKMMKTPNGTKFHQIMTFKPNARYYVTFNPSILNFEYLYTELLNKKMKSYAQKLNCQEDRDCFQKGISPQIHKQGYIQVFINDGKGQANIVKNS